MNFKRHNMRKVFFLTSVCLAFTTCLFCGCSPDDENDNHLSSTTATTQKITAPKFDNYLTTTELLLVCYLKST